MDQRDSSQGQPDYGQPPQFGDQSQYGGQQYGQPYQPPQPPQPPKKKTTGLRFVQFGCLGVVALVLIIVIAVAVGGSKASNSASSSTSTTTAAAPAATSTGDGNTSAAIAPAATTAQATVAAQVTYTCTGSAPDGVDVTYGPSGSNYSASHLPFTKTMALDASAQYYVTEAQLSGSGQVTCTTTIQTNDGTQTVNTATAQGGYNIATAEICSSFDGAWDKC